MILALSGRRIDPPGGYPARFPLMNGELVRERIRNLLEKHAVTAIVCSAACGADLLAHREAGSLGIRRKVVLPYDRSSLRKHPSLTGLATGVSTTARSIRWPRTKISSHWLQVPMMKPPMPQRTRPS